MGVSLWGDLPSPKAAARQEVPCSRTYGVHANGILPKGQAEGKSKIPRIGGRVRKEGLKQVPPKSRDEPPRRRASHSLPPDLIRGTWSYPRRFSKSSCLFLFAHCGFRSVIRKPSQYLSHMCYSRHMLNDSQAFLQISKFLLF
jgi:hypothetical protein